MAVLLSSKWRKERSPCQLKLGWQPRIRLCMTLGSPLFSKILGDSKIEKAMSCVSTNCLIALLDWQLLCGSWVNQVGHPDYQEKKIFVIIIPTDCWNASWICSKSWGASSEMDTKGLPISVTVIQFSLSFLVLWWFLAWLFELKKTDLLFSNLQSIATNHQWGNRCKVFLSRQKTSTLVWYHIQLFTNFFDVQKLRMPAIQAEPTVQNPLANVSSHFRLGTVISEQSLEEVVCGAHIALHKRTPCSIEIPWN